MKIRRIVPGSVTVVLALLVGSVLYDLFYPRTAKMREFDPNEVARLETAMWRSYYDKKQVQLFNQLSELLRTQYHMPLVRSNQVAYYAANAAFIFKEGRSTAHYEKAIPDLVKFYGAIRKMSDIPFDAEKVARLELQWWIVHRERWKRPAEDLPRALAELQSAIYGVSVDKVMEHGRLRAEAMKIRDAKADDGTPMTEEDWAKISDLLRQSWGSLAAAVKSSTHLPPPSNQANGSR